MAVRLRIYHSDGSDTSEPVDSLVFLVEGLGHGVEPDDGLASGEQLRYRLLFERDRPVPTVAGPFVEVLYSSVEPTPAVDLEEHAKRMLARITPTREAIGTPADAASLVRAVAALPELALIAVGVSVEDNDWRRYDPGDVDEAVAHVNRLIDDHYRSLERTPGA